MSTTPDIDLATHIGTNVGALTLGTNILAGPVRAVGTGVPDLCVFATATGGSAPEPFIYGGSGNEQRYHQLLVRIRSAPRAFEAGQTLARSVRDAVHHTTVAGYIDVEVRETDPVYLGVDDKGHHDWTVGVEMYSEE